MTVRLSVGVQAHPVRHDLAVALAARVDADVVWDPDPAGDPSPWRTYRAALEATPDDATHRCILQDDVTACAGFRDAATRAVGTRPLEPVAFFHGGQPREHLPLLNAALRVGDPWVTLTRFRWAPVVALSWPAALIPKVLAWVDEQQYPPGFRADDEICGRALTALAVPIHVTVPSLVQHPDEVPSIMRRRYPNPYDRRVVDPGRVAAYYIGAGDASLIRW